MRKIIFILLIGFLILLPASASGQGEITITPDPDPLSFKGAAATPLDLTFGLTPNQALTGVALAAGPTDDLEPMETFACESIAFSPADPLDLAADQAQSFILTIQPAEAGTANCTLSVSYTTASGEPGITTLPMTFEILPDSAIDSAPVEAVNQTQSEVAPAESSNNQVLHLNTTIWPVKTIDQNNEPEVYWCQSSGESAFLIEQSGKNAALTSTNIDPLCKTGGNCSDGNKLAVDPALGPNSTTVPFNAGATTVLVSGKAPCLPAGAYTTQLRVTSDAQPDVPILIPFTVESRLGWLAPILLCLAGFVGSALSMWWNQRGRKMLDVRKRVEAIQSKLNESQSCLTAAERTKHGNDLYRIMQQVDSSQPVETIEVALTKLETELTAAQKACRELVDKANLLKVDLQTAIEPGEGRKPGKKLAKKWIGKLDGLIEWLETGKFETIGQAQTAYNTLEQAKNEWQAAVAKFELAKSGATVDQQGQTFQNALIVDGSVDTEKVTSLATKLDDAESLEKFKADLAGALRGEPDVDWNALAKTSFKGAPEQELTPAEALMKNFAFRIKLQQAGMVIIFYTISLVGGLLALYVPNPTWGAAVSDYTTLFVWALTVNFVGGQMIDLGGSLKPKV